MKKTVSLVLSVMILCAVCVSRAAGNELPVFASFRDALDSTKGYAEIREHDDYIVLVLEMDGRYFRMITLLDDHAKELYKTAEKEYSTASMEACDSYAWALPLNYIEELADMPKDQAELDELKGKTIQELMDEGFGEEMIIDKNEMDFPVHICLEYGSYKYEFEVTNAASGYPYLMTIKNGKFNGLSRAAFYPDIPEDRSDPQ